jgi:hypothetical protein
MKQELIITTRTFITDNGRRLKGQAVHNTKLIAITMRMVKEPSVEYIINREFLIEFICSQDFLNEKEKYCVDGLSKREFRQFKKVHPYFCIPGLIAKCIMRLGHLRSYIPEAKWFKRRYLLKQANAK